MDLETSDLEASRQEMTRLLNTVLDALAKAKPAHPSLACGAALSAAATIAIRTLGIDGPEFARLARETWNGMALSLTHDKPRQ